MLKLVLAILLTASCTFSFAINKCTDKDGNISYQNEKCKNENQEEVLTIVDTVGYTGYTGSSVYSGYTDSSNKQIYTGPRGGQYTITASGNKSYISRK